MEKRPEIVLMVGSLSGDLIGGMQAQAEGMARELSGDFDVVVLTRAFPGNRMIEEREDYRVIRKPVGPVPGARWIFDLILTSWLLARRKNRVAAIVAYQTLGTGLVAVLAGRLLGIPVLVSIRSESEYRTDVAGPIKLRLSRITWSLARRVLVQSGPVRDAFLRAPATVGLRDWESFRARVAAVPNGVDPATTTLAPDRPDRVVFVGRLHPEKGLEHLVDAVGRLPAPDRPGLLLVGGGPTRGALVARARERQVSISITGQVPRERVHGFLGQGGIFVLPSLVEGMSNALLEAMSFGLPVAATTVGSARDVLVDGQNGLLVPPGDAEALRQAIRCLQTDEPLRRRLARGAAESAATYSWAAQKQRLVEQLRLAGARLSPA